MNGKVILGLSGGVDSAVTAKLLEERSYEVFGLFLDIGKASALSDARAAADFLKIPLTVLDIRRELEEHVCAPFTAAYLRGETPNPCILCNPKVKLKALMDQADRIGAKYISTGHYARAENGRLFKGRAANDQSYMLCRITSGQLARLLLPLGGFEKTETRRMAREMGIPVSQKPDSMEICFIPDGDYAAYIEGRTVSPLLPGNFVTPDGEILGTHRGIHRYTAGQRRGLGIAAGSRVFVSDIRPETNEVVISGGEDLFTDKILVRDINWISPQPDDFDADIKIRHSRIQTPATVRPNGPSAEIVFHSPVRAPTRGQSAVFYIGDELTGGGFISSS